MNERIKELAEQAEMSANKGDHVDVKIMMEKFAELIVRECIATVESEALAYAEPTWAMEIVNNLYETFELK